MKTITLKKLSIFILLLSGMFSFTFVNAQNCNGNKVWTCRTCYTWGIPYQECDCVSPNNVIAWQASPCGSPDNNGNHGNGNNGNSHGWDACICRLSNQGTGESSESIYPNPLSN